MEDSTRTWTAIRRVYASRRPPRLETIYALTRALLQRLGKLTDEEARRLPLPDVGEAIKIVAQKIVDARERSAWQRPCANPNARARPPISPYYSSYSLIYSPVDERPHRPRPEELDHCARQLEAFGGKATVVGEHIRVGRDLLSLIDARRLLATCEGTCKPPSRNLLLVGLQAMARVRLSLTALERG